MRLTAVFQGLCKCLVCGPILRSVRAKQPQWLVHVYALVLQFIHVSYIYIISYAIYKEV